MATQTNLDAWECLDQALFVSSHVSAKDAEKGETDWENVYPISLDETDTMEDLVNQAEQKADDPTDSAYRTRVNELRNIIDYSRTKHRTWKWSVIFGAIISAAIMWYFGSDSQEEAAKKQQVISQIEKWEKRDTMVAYDKISASQAGYLEDFSSANAYKVSKLALLKNSEEGAIRNAEYYHQKADTATVEKNKKYCLEHEAYNKESAKKARAEFDEVAKMKFDDIRKLALEQQGKRVESSKGSATRYYAYMVFLIILIPLYIITGYSYGYMIYRHRRQKGIMRILRKAGFGLATFFFGTGIMMNLLPDNIVKYTYSSGHTETRQEANILNIFVFALKAGLMILGVVIFCFVSVFIMIIETVTGLKRNINWSPVVAKIKSTAN